MIGINLLQKKNPLIEEDVYETVRNLLNSLEVMEIHIKALYKEKELFRNTLEVLYKRCLELYRDKSNLKGEVIVLRSKLEVYES